MHPAFFGFVLHEFIQPYMVSLEINLKPFTFSLSLHFSFDIFHFRTLPRVAVHLQCVAMCCSVLQCTTLNLNPAWMWAGILSPVSVYVVDSLSLALSPSICVCVCVWQAYVLRYWCMQRDGVCNERFIHTCSVLHIVAVRCSVLQCVAYVGVCNEMCKLLRAS